MPAIPVLIDCDTGIDDIVALAYATRCEQLDIKGITTVAGNQLLEMTTRNTLDALRLFDREDIPLAAGADRPLARPLMVAAHIHGDNGLGGYRFENPSTRQALDIPAHEFMHRHIMSAAEPLTIIAIGPLTNIALLFQKYPEDVRLLREIVFMGGSIRAGNPTPVSTFNVLCDPEAARVVIRSGVPFTMCSLECTRRSYVTAAELDAVKRLGGKVPAMIGTVTDFALESCAVENIWLEHQRSLAIHDLCTMVAVTRPELFTANQYWADVETRGELTTGFTLVDYEDNLRKPLSEKTVRFLGNVDRDAYIAEFMRIFRLHSGATAN